MTIPHWLRVILRQLLPEHVALWIRRKWVVRQMLAGTAHREGEVDLLPQFVKPGSVCWDIGANVGTYTVALSALSTAVHAFEPVPHSLDILRTVVSTLELRNVAIHALAVSDATGPARISIPTEGFYGGYYMAALSEDGALAVQSTSIDDAIAQGVAEPDFIKCDVEGAETRVIHGARELIQRRHPSWLLETFDDGVLPLMQSLGYDAFVSSPGGEIRPVTKRLASARNYWFIASKS